MNDITRRVLDVYDSLKSQGLVKNQTDFCKRAGFSNSLFTDLRNKRVNAGMVVIRGILEEFQSIDARWLITGQGILSSKTAHTPVVSDANSVAHDPQIDYSPSATQANAHPSDQKNAHPTAHPTDVLRQLLNEKQHVIEQQKVSIELLKDMVEMLKAKTGG